MPAEPRLRFRIVSTSDRLWIAHVPPYTNVLSPVCCATCRAVPMCRRTSVGKSVEGREIPLLTITDTSVPERRRRLSG